MTLKRAFIFSLLLFSPAIAFAKISAPNEKAWVKDALNLSGESARTYRRTIRNLHANKNLDRELQSALLENNTHAFLALDVISVLKRESLYSAVVSGAKKDRSGFFWVTLNSFFSPAHQKELIELYDHILDDPQASLPAKMIALETLGRIQHVLPESKLKKILLDAKDPELRTAALYYVREFLKNNRRDYVNLIRDFRDQFKPNTNDPRFAADFESLLTEFKLQGKSS